MGHQSNESDVKNMSTWSTHDSPEISHGSPWITLDDDTEYIDSKEYSDSMGYQSDESDVKRMSTWSTHDSLEMSHGSPWSTNDIESRYSREYSESNESWTTVPSLSDWDEEEYYNNPEEEQEQEHQDQLDSVSSLDAVDVLNASANEDLIETRTQCCEYGKKRKLGDEDCFRERCSICQANIEDSEEVRYLPCRHFFHQRCIDEWLHSKRTCPLCRHDLIFPHTMESSDN